MLWRRGGSTKGFGFTLKGEHDFTLHAFHHRAAPELFHAYYGGKNECGGGHLMWREFDVSPSTQRVEFSARVFTVESWDGESFTMKLIDGTGTVRDERTQSARHNHESADWRSNGGPCGLHD